MFAFKTRKVAFVPLARTVSSMADLYEYNCTSRYEERKRMDDVRNNPHTFVRC